MTLESIRPIGATGPDLLFINAPSSFQQGVIADGEEPAWGLLRVANEALHQGKNVAILDAHRLKMSEEDMREIIGEVQPKAVAVNPTSVNVSETLKVTNYCEEEDIPYILGGIHATLDPIIARRDFSEAHAIVRGNGEAVIGELIEYTRERIQIPTKGVYFKGESHRRTDYADKLHPNDLHIVDQGSLVIDPIYTHEQTIGGTLALLNEATLYLTEGCPFACSFCASPVMANRTYGKPYSRPDTSRIGAEVEQTIRGLGANAIHFLDDMAFINAQQVSEFHNEMRQRGLLGEFYWRGLTRVNTVLSCSDDVMDQMKETGVWRLSLGVESGSEEMLRRIGKRTTKEQIRRGIVRLAEYGIQSKAFFIMGFPGETEDQLQETAAFIQELKDLGLNEISVFQFKPYPGTREYAWLQENNPKEIERLAYLHHPSSRSDKVEYKSGQKDVWLESDVQIAQVNSGIVREYVLGSLEQFYG